MTTPLTSETRRRRLRRPFGATRCAGLVALLLGAALALPQAGLAQDFGAAEVPSDLDTAVDQAVEAGGVPAATEGAVAEVLDALPPQPEAPPAPPAPPASPAPPAPPAAPPVIGEAPSETAPAPAPDGPPNVNVNVRVLSPSDGGDVVIPPDTDVEFNWTWRSVRSCEPAARAASSVTLNWIWETVDDCAAAVEEDLAAIPEAVSEPLAVLEQAPPGSMPAVPVRKQPPDPRPRVRAAPMAAPTFAPPAPAPFAAATIADAPAEPPPAAPPADREPPVTDGGPSPDWLPAPLLVAAAASAPAGGGGAPVAAALLALTCLLAPRLLELARARHRKLSSLLSSGRLERPG